MPERFEISFTDGGVGAPEVILTGGAAIVIEKIFDAITGDDNHGFYCNIKDTVTELEVSCWGSSKDEAEKNAREKINTDIEYFVKDQQRERERAREEAEEWEKEQRRKKQLERESERPTNPQDPSSNENESGCAKIIAWLFAVGVVVYAVVMAAVYVVLPVTFLNSALIFAILALVYPKKRTLFAILSLIGGCYMLLDVTKGLLSELFVSSVIGNADWIKAFVYINAASMGLSTAILIKPIWTTSKSTLTKVALFLLVTVSILIAPMVFHSVQNPFVQNSTNLASKFERLFNRTAKTSSEESVESQSESPVSNEILFSRPDSQPVESEVFESIDTSVDTVESHIVDQTIAGEATFNGKYTFTNKTPRNIYLFLTKGLYKKEFVIKPNQSFYANDLKPGLYQYLYSYFESSNFPNNEVEGEILVDEGKSKKLELKLPKAIFFTISNKEWKRIDVPSDTTYMIVAPYKDFLFRFSEEDRERTDNSWTELPKGTTQIFVKSDSENATEVAIMEFTMKEDLLFEE